MSLRTTTTSACVLSRSLPAEDLSSPTPECVGSEHSKRFSRGETMRKDTLTLRALLMDTFKERELHESLPGLCGELRHAPFYDIPFGWVERLREHDLHTDDVLHGVEQDFSLPEGGAILLGAPGALFSFIDIVPGARGLAAPRRFVEVQAQTLDGEMWEGPFDVRKMAFSIAISDVTGPGTVETGDSFRSSVPLVIRVDLTDAIEASVVLDPNRDDVHDEKAVTGAVLTAVVRAGTAFALLAHLQQSGTLEQYRVASTPDPNVH